MGSGASVAALVQENRGGCLLEVARSRAIWSADPNSVPRRTRMIVSKLFYRIESVHEEEQRLKENSITEIHRTWLPIYDARPEAPAEAPGVWQLTYTI